MSKTSERRRNETERLLRELPSVDPGSRGRLFERWSDAKQRSQEALGNGSATAEPRRAEPFKPASLRDRAPSAPPPRKPPPPRRGGAATRGESAPRRANGAAANGAAAPAGAAASGGAATAGVTAAPRAGAVAAPPRPAAPAPTPQPAAAP